MKLLQFNFEIWRANLLKKQNTFTDVFFFIPSWQKHSRLHRGNFTNTHLHMTYVAFEISEYVYFELTETAFGQLYHNDTQNGPNRWHRYSKRKIKPW